MQDKSTAVAVLPSAVHYLQNANNINEPRAGAPAIARQGTTAAMAKYRACFGCFNLIIISRGEAARPNTRRTSRPRRTSARRRSRGRLLGPLRGDTGAGVTRETAWVGLFVDAARRGWRAAGWFRQCPSGRDAKARRAARPPPPAADDQSLRLPGCGDPAG